MVLSSNLTKGSNERAQSQETRDGFEIKRYSALKLGGESFMRWFSGKTRTDLENFKPEAIIVHSYRHPHTTAALKTAKNIGAKIFLVTHAPFIERNQTRGFFAKIAVSWYDKFIGPKTLNLFDGIITITHWEKPHLISLGVNEDKLTYIPNGIPPEFFSEKKTKEIKRKILFFGRISPIKNLEVLIEALNILRNENLFLEIKGKPEETYKKKLLALVTKYDLQEKTLFSEPVYDLKDKIMALDSAEVFVLPSLREAMPQALIEAMAREKIVISSDNQGSREIISSGKNGYLFENGDPVELSKKLEIALSRPSKKIVRNARDSVRQFNWNNIIKKLESLLNKNA